MVQVHVPARVWGFESLLRHQHFSTITARLIAWLFVSALDNCSPAILRQSHPMRETHSGSSHPRFVIFPPPRFNVERPRRYLWRFIVPLVFLNFLVIAGLGTWWYRCSGTPESSLARLGH